MELGITTYITDFMQERLLTEEREGTIEAQSEKYLLMTEKIEQINEEPVRAEESAEESNKLKTIFLHNISHEIRTPMNGIMGFIQLLKSPDLSEENKLDYIKAIEQSGTRMLNLINDLIDLSELEAGIISCNSKETNLNRMFGQLFNFFKPQADNKNLGIDYKTEFSDESCTIETDEIKLYQILNHLLKNALKFTKEGAVSFGYYLKSNMLVFYVQDTGIGIHESHKGIIFERFTQVEMSVSRKFEGAGIGLSIVKSYVELLGGTIWVESELGKGSVFSFTIPLIWCKCICQRLNTP